MNMSEPKPQYIANLIVQKLCTNEFVDLRKVIYDNVKAVCPLSDEEAWDYVDRYLQDVATELFCKESYAKETHTPIPFDIDEESGNYYIKSISNPSGEHLKALFNITDDQFEVFCASIINKLGGKGIRNGGWNDGGIDFIGEGLMIKGMPFESTIGSQFYLIGQAKHYKDGHQVTLNECREFLGAAMKFRDQLRKSGSCVAFQPLILAYWTTYDFHKEALDFLQSMGVWYLNGMALSCLALSLGITPEDIMGITL